MDTNLFVQGSWDSSQNRIKMPVCTLRTNKSGADIPDAFLTEFPRVVADALGKPIEV